MKLIWNFNLKITKITVADSKQNANCSKFDCFEFFSFPEATLVIFHSQFNPKPPLTRRRHAKAYSNKPQQNQIRISKEEINGDPTATRTRSCGLGIRSFIQLNYGVTQNGTEQEGKPG